MSGLGINENDLDNYLKSGRLNNTLVRMVLMVKPAIEKNPSRIDLNTWPEKDRKVYSAVISDLDSINSMLNNMNSTSRKALCPYDVMVENNGYRFLRYGQNGHCYINIEKDGFFCKIGIIYDGDVEAFGNGVNITGYYHIGINGSVDELKLALENTMQYFPKIHFHKYEMNNKERNSSFLFELIDKVLKANIRYVGDFSKNGQGEIVHIIDSSIMTDDTVEKLIAGLKKIYPALRIEKYYKHHRKGIMLVEDDVPALLAAADKPQKEQKTVEKLDVTKDSLKWIIAKSIWKKLPETKIKEFQESMPDLSEVLSKAKKFA